MTASNSQYDTAGSVLEQLEAASKSCGAAAPVHEARSPVPPSETTMAHHNKAGVVIKNTFLEVGDHITSMHDWRRQLSEPVKVYTTVTDDDEEYEETADAEAPEDPPMPFAMAPPSTSSTNLGSNLQPNLAVQPGAVPQAGFESPCFEAR
eukprot:Skav234252  [mRNA]  locus=scaffold1464:656670:664481:- [translate_table: standard]